MEELPMKDDKRVRRDSTSSRGSEMEDFKESKVRYHISVDREISNVVWFCVWDTQKFPNNQYYHWLPHNQIDAQSIEFYFQSKERKTAKRMNMNDESRRTREEYIVISDDEDDDDEEEKKESQDVSDEEFFNNVVNDVTNDIRCSDEQHEDAESIQEKTQPKIPEYIMIQTLSDNSYKKVSLEELKKTRPAFVASFIKRIKSGQYDRIREGHPIDEE